MSFYVNHVRFGTCGLRGSGFTGPASCSVTDARPESPGQFTITAVYGGDSSHSPSATTGPASAILTVTAPPRRGLPQLRLTLHPARFAIGRCTRVRLTVTATIDGRMQRLRGAHVSFAGKRRRTDRRGQVVMIACFRRPGVDLARVQLRGFSSGSFKAHATRRRR
ncbi:MAG: Ig-like domain-containing protein [Solirubrobacteraceae bacterium]